MQVALNGLIAGLQIALFATAFTVVYLPSRVFHIALAGVFAAAPYVAWSAMKHGWPWWLAFLAAVATATALSMAAEWLNHRRLERRGASSGVHLVSSIGIQIILVQSVALIWGNQSKVLRTDVEEVYRMGDLVVSQAQLVEALVSVALLGGFFVWLRLSRIGLWFRALADNPTELALRGYNVAWLRLLAFGISGFLTGAAALCGAFDLGFDPHGGLHAMLLAVVAMIVGGRATVIGPLVGGLLLGLVRSEVVWYLSARWQEPVTFLLLAGFLLARPQGLLGQRQRLEAAP